ANGQPLLHHLAHRGNAAPQLEITGRVVCYGSPSVCELTDIVIREPHTMGSNKAGVKGAEVSQMPHQCLAPALLAGDGLDFGFGQMGMQANAVVTRQTYTATEEGVAALARNGRSHSYADASRSGTLPAPDSFFSDL